MQAEFMNPDFHAQIYLSVPPLFASSDKPRNVWLQYLMDVPLKVCSPQGITNGLPGFLGQMIKLIIGPKISYV